MKKLNVVCAVAILALAAMVLIGCDQPTSNPGDNPSNPGNNPSNPSDSWTKVETVDGLEGVWKSSITATPVSSSIGEQMTIVTTITYPTTDEKLNMSFVYEGEGGDENTYLLSKEEAETALKDGQVPIDFFYAFGYMEVNADKTKLKVTATVKEGDPNWEEVNMMVEVGTFEGDIKITSEPTQITIIQYYNKQK